MILFSFLGIEQLVVYAVNDDVSYSLLFGSFGARRIFIQEWM